jgi:hypothetical protein
MADTQTTQKNHFDHSFFLNNKYSNNRNSLPARTTNTQTGETAEAYNK